jgi:hypothetical protein
VHGINRRICIISASSELVSLNEKIPHVT